jgi:hypothetical protein
MLAGTAGSGTCLPRRLPRSVFASPVPSGRNFRERGEICKVGEGFGGRVGGFFLFDGRGWDLVNMVRWGSAGLQPLRKATIH